MSCNDNNPCGQPCNDCVDNNPCYETGCLNPTTFECLTKPGDWINIGVNDNMNGKQVLQAIDSTVQQLELTISEITGGDGADADSRVGVTGSDTTPGVLNAKLVEGTHVKKSILGLGGNERISLSVTPETMISHDADNILQLDTEKRLKVVIPGSNAKVYAEGEGIKFSDAAGTNQDPIMINLATSGVVTKRTCFDGEWRNVALNTISNSDVSIVSGQPKYRIRYDGTVEFKGSVTFTVKFGQYSSATSEHIITLGALPTNCISASEIAGIADLKSIGYIEPFQPSGDLISQQYNYIIRKSNQNILIEFQSSFSAITTKTIVVNFDGTSFHPNI